MKMNCISWDVILIIEGIQEIQKKNILRGKKNDERNILNILKHIIRIWRHSSLAQEQNETKKILSGYH
jgi:hypothetical protein